MTREMLCSGHRAQVLSLRLAVVRGREGSQIRSGFGGRWPSGHRLAGLLVDGLAGVRRDLHLLGAIEQIPVDRFLEPEHRRRGCVGRPAVRRREGAFGDFSLNVLSRPRNALEAQIAVHQNFQRARHERALSYCSRHAAAYAHSARKHFMRFGFFVDFTKF